MFYKIGYNKLINDSTLSVVVDKSCLISGRTLHEGKNKTRARTHRLLFAAGESCGFQKVLHKWCRVLQTDASYVLSLFFNTPRTFSMGLRCLAHHTPRLTELWYSPWCGPTAHRVPRRRSMSVRYFPTRWTTYFQVVSLILAADNYRLIPYSHRRQTD